VASGKTMVDFGTTPSFAAGAVVIAVADLTRGGLAEAWVLMESTPDHSRDEVLASPIEVRAEITADLDVVVRASSALALTGRYRVGWVTYDDSDWFKGFSYIDFPPSGDGFFRTLGADSPAAQKIFPGTDTLPAWTLSFWFSYGPDAETGRVARGAPGNLFAWVNSTIEPALTMTIDVSSSLTHDPFTVVMANVAGDPVNFNIPPGWVAGDQQISYAEGKLHHLLVTCDPNIPRIDVYFDGKWIGYTSEVTGYGTPTGDVIQLGYLYTGRILSPWVKAAATSAAKVRDIYREGPRWDARDYAVDHWSPGDGDTGTTVTDRGTAADADFEVGDGALVKVEDAVVIYSFPGLESVYAQASTSVASYLMSPGVGGISGSAAPMPEWTFVAWVRRQDAANMFVFECAAEPDVEDESLKLTISPAGDAVLAAQSEGQIDEAFAQATIDITDWTLIAARHTATHLQLVVDGVQVDSAACAFSMPMMPTISVGAVGSNGSTGDISQPAIYSRAIPDAELVALAAAGLGHPLSRASGAWPGGEVPVWWRDMPQGGDVANAGTAGHCNLSFTGAVTRRRYPIN